MSEQRAERGIGRTILVGALLALGLLALAVPLFRKRLAPAPPPLPVIAQVGDFSLTNQFGQVTSSRGLAGHIWVADVIFSRCPGPCALMTERMRELQARLPAGWPVTLVSLTADPAYDRPDVLRRYSQRFGARPGNWLFLTGKKQAIYHVALDYLKLAVAEDDSPEARAAGDLFIHSTKLMVVDKENRVRAFFEGTDQGVVSKVLEAVRALQREES